MKRITYSSLLILLMLCLSSETFGQIKRFTLNVQQPSMELCAVSVNPDKIETQLKIFPNPTKGDITILFVEPMISSTVNIQVYSLDGKILLSKEEYSEKSTFQKKIDLSFLSKGIYLIKISGESFLENQRVVIY